MIQTLLIATGNRHKVEEIRQILADLAYPRSPHLLCLKDLPGYVAPEEDGDSFRANAVRKATCPPGISAAYPTLADDSGLVTVEALGRGAGDLFRPLRRAGLRMTQPTGPSSWRPWRKSRWDSGRPPSSAGVALAWPTGWPRPVPGGPGGSGEITLDGDRATAVSATTVCSTCLPLGKTMAQLIAGGERTAGATGVVALAALATDLQERLAADAPLPCGYPHQEKSILKPKHVINCAINRNKLCAFFQETGRNGLAIP